MLTWRAADESDPEEIQVRFDGEPLAVERGRVSLPRHDRRSVHVLTAELIFHDQLRAEVEVAFGGDYGEEVSTELTAVPLELDGWKSLPSAAEVESWLRIGDQPARVVAVESGPREVVLVRDDASMVTLRSLGRQTSGSRSSPHPVGLADERRPGPQGHLAPDRHASGRWRRSRAAGSPCSFRSRQT